MRKINKGDYYKPVVQNKSGAKNLQRIIFLFLLIEEIDSQVQFCFTLKVFVTTRIGLCCSGLLL